jgi:hypothetical protein
LTVAICGVSSASMPSPFSLPSIVSRRGLFRPLVRLPADQDDAHRWPTSMSNSGNVIAIDIRAKVYIRDQKTWRSLGTRQQFERLFRIGRIPHLKPCVTQKFCDRVANERVVIQN